MKTFTNIRRIFSGVHDTNATPAGQIDGKQQFFGFYLKFTT